MTLRGAIATVALALAAPAAAADPFPGRGGESGLLDVPTADAAPAGSAAIAAEFSVARASGMDATVSPFPVSVVTGLGHGLEAGAALRQWGRPGDPVPSPTLFSGALKLQLVGAEGFRPALAVDAYVDRANKDRSAGGRLLVTPTALGALRLSGFAGAERTASAAGVAPTAGLAAALAVGPRLGVVADGVFGRDGALAGGALRWQLGPSFGVSVGADWVPRERGVRFAVGLAVAARPKRQAQAAAPAAAPVPAVAPVPAAGPAAPRFADDRPHFRMRLDLAGDAPARAHMIAAAPPVDADARAREAVLAHRVDVERCVAAALARAKLARSEGVLTVHVAQDGRVAVARYAPERAALRTEECLRDAARGWKLPAAAAPYEVVVPIAVGAREAGR